MTETLTETRLMAEVYRGSYGCWNIRLTGNGAATEHALIDPDKLLELRRDGYILTGDVELYVALYGPAELQEPELSQSAMDADSAGHPGELPGCGMSFDDADIYGKDEVAYFESKGEW